MKCTCHSVSVLFNKLSRQLKLEYGPAFCHLPCYMTVEWPVLACFFCYASASFLMLLLETKFPLLYKKN